MDREAKVLNFPVATSPDEDLTGKTEGPVATEAPASKALVSPAQSEAPPPVWMQRLAIISTVIICCWIGFILAALPWLPQWTENSLISDFPNVRWLLGTGFVRGLVTGIGVLDLWIGISEAVHYRDRH
jgi:hypothetical protein